VAPERARAAGRPGPAAGFAEIQIPLFETPGREIRRREEREAVVRHVEYCRFPRVCADQRLRVGFTRDLSASGLCLRAEGPEPAGALLRVALRRIDGRREREGIARVAWSRPVGDGTYWLGLALLESDPSRPIRIRTLSRPARQVLVS